MNSRRTEHNFFWNLQIQGLGNHGYQEAKTMLAKLHCTVFYDFAINCPETESDNSGYESQGQVNSHSYKLKTRRSDHEGCQYHNETCRL